MCSNYLRSKISLYFISFSLSGLLTNVGLKFILDYQDYMKIIFFTMIVLSICYPFIILKSPYISFNKGNLKEYI